MVLWIFLYETSSLYLFLFTLYEIEDLLYSTHKDLNEHTQKYTSSELENTIFSFNFS